MLLATVAAADDVNSNGSEKKTEGNHLLLTGQAFDHMGSGVNDAKVTVALKATGATIGEDSTNDYGDFKITADKPITGIAIITIQKPFHKDVVTEVELGTADGPPFVDASMVGNVSLVGKVQSKTDGTPVPHAKLRGETGYNEWNAEADTEGAFKVEDLPPGPTAITIEAEKFARKRIKIDAVESAGAQTIELEPERIAHLRITDESSNPIKGVGVECLDEPIRDYRQEITDDQGRVVIRGLRYDAKQLRIRLSHERYVSETDFDRTIELPADANVSTHGLVIREAGMIAGTVTTATNDEPLYGARISAGRVLDDRQPRAWTDFDGAFRLVGVTPGKTVVTVHLSGHAPQLREVQVNATEEVKVDFKLVESRNISGTIVDPENKPIPGAYISATRWEGHDTLGLQAMADDTGKFLILDAPHETFEISLYAPGFKPLIDQSVESNRDAYEFQLALDPRKGPGVGGAGPEPGSDAPDFTVTTLDDKKITLSELKGKIVLVDFWATWCGPCVGEIPHLVETHKAYAKRDDFVMLSISIEDDVSRVREFVDARKMEWHSAAGSQSGAQMASESYEVNAIPALFVIDREGKVAARNLRGTQVAKTVGELLNQAD